MHHLCFITTEQKISGGSLISFYASSSSSEVQTSDKQHSNPPKDANCANASGSQSSKLKYHCKAKRKTGPGDGVGSGQARVRIVVETGDAEEKAHADVQPQMLAAPTVVSAPAKSSVRDALDASVAAAVEKGVAVASTAAPNAQA